MVNYRTISLSPYRLIALSPYRMKMKVYIDSHKGVTFITILLLMAFYNQWQNATAWVYLALHGTYGLLWVLKSQVFPDKQWERPVHWTYGLFVIWGGLSTYWLAPLLLIARGVEAPPWYLGICVSLYTVGIFLHFGADMQKHTSLALRPGHLIRTGLWAKCRNPNYFGEFLIYLSFALLAMHWLPLVILALFIGLYWYPNMRRKDRSLARYPEFAAYQARSKLFIPYLF